MRRAGIVRAQSGQSRSACRVGTLTALASILVLLGVSMPGGTSGAQAAAEAAVKDRKAPSTRVAGKRVRTVAPGTVRLRFRGTDRGSGIRSFRVERRVLRVSRRGYRRLSVRRSSRLAVRVKPGRTYLFVVRGRDRAGNLERRPRRADLVLRVRRNGSLTPAGPKAPAQAPAPAPAAGGSSPAETGNGTGSARATGIGDLTVEHLVEPLGIDAVRPRFAWRTEAQGRGFEQAAYQLAVASSPEAAARGEGDLWESGRVTSPQQAEVEYAGRDLASTTRYYWAVRVWDAAGAASAWSASASFETAFVDASQFKGEWIGRVPTSPAVPNTERPEPLLRREFDLPKDVAQARLHISGLGYYEAALNGARVGDHQLDPGFTSYDKTVLYVTHDVTQQLRRGENAIGVRLGRGFYATKTGGSFYQWYATPWNSDPKVKLQLDVRFTDGTTASILSDEKWKAADGPTTRDSVLLGDVYDARIEPAGWTGAEFNDFTWAPAVLATPPQGALRAQTAPPIRVTGATAPEAITRPKSGVAVYDFGIPRAGWSRVRLRGPAGTKVTVKYGEKLLPDGTVQHTGSFYAPDEQLQTDTYTLSGNGTETWEPRYSYKGYRYVELEGSPALPEVVDIEGRLVHNDVKSVGGFKSSSALFNGLHAAMRRTMLANLHSIPTDTPMYEKNGWTADAHLFADSSIRNFDMAAFWEKWMGDVRDSQRPAGDLPAISPTPPRGFGDLIDPVWAAAYVYINWDLYTYYGDVRTLREHYDPMKRWIEHLESTIRGTEYIWEGYSFGDWVSPGNVFAPEGTRLAGTAFVYDQTRTMARIARVRGQDEDAKRFDTLAETIARRFNEEFYNAEKGIYETEKKDVGYRQGSNLFALHFDLVPAGERKRVLENLVQDIMVTRKGHLNTGAPSTKMILPVLTEAGYGDVAYTVATNPTYPGWGFWAAKGATTMWEYWEEGSRSRQHAFMGTIDDWFFTHLAGLQPAAPGWREITVKPYLIGDLDHASAHTTTPSGRAASGWRKKGDRLELTVEVPPNTTAQISVPTRDAASVTEGGRPAAEAPGLRTLGSANGYATYAVGSGTYVFGAAL